MRVVVVMGWWGGEGVSVYKFISENSLLYRYD